MYFLLAPVNRPLALLGSVWRLANAAVLAVGIIANLVALDSLAARGSAPQPLQASLMISWLDVHGTAESVGLIFFSLGAGVHSYLFYRSRFIPRLLSGAYLLVTSLLFVFCFGILLISALESVVVPWIIAPDFLVKFAVALWLTTKGVSATSGSSA